jgi:5-methylcytosine-specific restriction endonuclease McrA
VKRRCLTCRTVIASGSYCARCRPRNGSTRAWRDLREQILLRDRGACVLCGRLAVEVDHIIPLSEGGSDSPGNLRSLCAPCHARSHQFDLPPAA